MAVSNRVRRYIFLGIMGIIILFGTAGAAAPSSPTDITVSSENGAEVSDPNILLQYGPTGGIITITLGGILMIVKAVNEGRTIQVAHYKERAEMASADASRDVQKVRDQLTRMEKSIDELNDDRDELREALEQRKAQFSRELLALEKRHQEQILDSHELLLKQYNVRYKLEKLLSEHGVEVPDFDPPPGLPNVTNQ